MSDSPGLSARTSLHAGSVLGRERGGGFRLLPFLGPAFVACVAYIDPGNFATNIAGGSKFGYLLVWVIVAANLLTGVTAFGILGLQRFGFRPFEATIAAIVGVIGVCYVGELFYAKPPLGTVAKHAFVPQFSGGESVLLAVGILGATVMPHVIYLHSALTQERVRPETEEQARRLYKYTRVDVIIAMTLAGLINIAMLVTAASTFYKRGLLNVASLETAHRTLNGILGRG